MYAWESIQLTLDYIENHFSETLSINELSAQAALSPFYFQRQFSKIVKKPVMEYIKLRRLAHASEMLRNRKDKIIHIALDCGFASPEIFTRSFKEIVGITPKEYRNKPIMLNHFDKPELVLDMNCAVNNSWVHAGMVFEIKNMKLPKSIHFVGISDFIPFEKQLPAGEVCGPDFPGLLWDDFHNLKPELPCIASGTEIGVSYFDEKTPSGCFKYFTGTETNCLDAPYEYFELPARDYIVCTFEAETFEKLVTEVLNKAIKFTAGWMIKHELIMDVFAAEIYHSDDTSMMELWYPYKVK